MSSAPCAAALAAPALGDLDGDGALDLAVGGVDGAVAFFDQTFSPLLPPLRLKKLKRVSPALVDLDGDGDLDLLLTSELRRPLGVRNEGTRDAPAFAVDGLGYARTFRVDVLGRGGSLALAKVAAGRVAGAETLVVASAAGLAFARLVDDGLVFFEPPFNSTFLADVDPAAMSRSLPLDAAGSAAPALGDLTGDGVDDLLLGGHHGTVFFFDGAAKVSPRFGGPDDADEDAVDNFYFQTAFRVDVPRRRGTMKIHDDRAARGPRARNRESSSSRRSVSPCSQRARPSARRPAWPPGRSPRPRAGPCPTTRSTSRRSSRTCRKLRSSSRAP